MRIESHSREKPTHRSFILASAAALAFAVPAFAEFDVSPAVGPGNQIVINAFADADETLIENVRVFGFAFGEVPGQPYFLSDPGFHPLPGSGFAAGSSVGFDLAAPLQFWSGNGAPSFATIASGASIRFDYGASSVISSGGATPSPAGYTFAVVDASGEADDHVETYLLASGGTIANPGTPADGVYLVTARITSSTTGVLASEPTYWLFANNVSEDVLDEAARHARDTFAPDSTLVPEPMTSTAALGIATLIARRCRR